MADKIVKLKVEGVHGNIYTAMIYNDDERPGRVRIEIGADTESYAFTAVDLIEAIRACSAPKEAP